MTVYNALNNLSGTLERRGGLGDAMIDAAKVKLGLSRLAAEKKRQGVLDARATESWEAGAARRKLDAQQAEEQVKPVELNMYNFIPKDLTADQAAHLFSVPGKARNPKDGRVSIVDDTPGAVLGRGHTWVMATGRILDPTGKPVVMPAWKAEKFGNGMVGIISTRTSPIKVAKAELDKHKERLSTMDKKSSEYKMLSGRIKQVKRLMKTPEWKLSQYEKYEDMQRQIKATAASRGAKPDYLRRFDEAIRWSEGKRAGILKGIKDSKSATLKEREIAAKELTAKAAMEKAKRSGKATADPFIKNRLSDISKSIAEIDKIVAGGVVSDGMGGKVPMTVKDQTRLLAQRAALYGEAQSLQGGVKKTVPEGQKPDTTKEAGPEAQKPASDFDELYTMTTQKVPDMMAPSHSAAPEEPNIVNATVDEDGTVWGVDSSGQTTRIAVKPVEQVRDGQGVLHDNPEYIEYLTLLKQYGLK